MPTRNKISYFSEFLGYFHDATHLLSVDVLATPSSFCLKWNVDALIIVGVRDIWGNVTLGEYEERCRIKSLFP